MVVVGGREGRRERGRCDAASSHSCPDVISVKWWDRRSGRGSPALRVGLSPAVADGCDRGRCQDANSPDLLPLLPTPALLCGSSGFL